MGIPRFPVTANITFVDFLFDAAQQVSPQHRIIRFHVALGQVARKQIAPTGYVWLAMLISENLIRDEFSRTR